MNSPPEGIGFTALWHQQREDHTSSGADQGTPKELPKRVAAARAQCATLPQPRNAGGAASEGLHTLRALLFSGPTYNVHICRDHRCRPLRGCGQTPVPFGSGQCSLGVPGAGASALTPARSRQRVGEVLEGGGLGQLLQDAVLLEVLLRRSRQLAHNAGDDQHVWRPGICKRTAWVSTTVTEQGVSHQRSPQWMCICAGPSQQDGETCALHHYIYIRLGWADNTGCHIQSF